ncbi:hypothetical protein MicB006_2581 [Micromonospora sp. B006]|nr:hypothetical protein MicB006_2581 [Micromonospora sp. B006]
MSRRPAPDTGRRFRPRSRRDRSPIRFDRPWCVRPVREATTVAQPRRRAGARPLDRAARPLCRPGAGPGTGRAVRGSGARPPDRGRAAARTAPAGPVRRSSRDQAIRPCPGCWPGRCAGRRWWARRRRWTCRRRCDHCCRCRRYWFLPLLFVRHRRSLCSLWLLLSRRCRCRCRCRWPGCRGCVVCRRRPAIRTHRRRMPVRPDRVTSRTRTSESPHVTRHGRVVPPGPSGTECPPSAGTSPAPPRPPHRPPVWTPLRARAVPHPVRAAQRISHHPRSPSHPPRPAEDLGRKRPLWGPFRTKISAGRCGKRRVR